MIKHVLMIAALALSACGVQGAASAPPLMPGAIAAPAPLAGTNIDEQGIKLAFEAYDLVLYSVDALVAAGVLVKNSPRALVVQDWLVAAQRGLNAASAAQKAGNAADYGTALAEARKAFEGARLALKGDR